MPTRSPAPSAPTGSPERHRGRPWLSSHPRGPARPDRQGPTLVAALEARAGRDPTGPFVRFHGRTLSWSEVWELSGALSAELQHRGVRRGDRVGICLQNDPQFVVALFGAWRAGAIAVPLNPMLKERELATILADAGVGVVVALESLAPVLAVAGGEGIDLITTHEADWASSTDDWPGPVAPRAPADPDGDLLSVVRRRAGQAASGPPPDLDDTAVLVYTSGTTGPPKGAMNSHANIAFNARAKCAWFPVTDQDVVLGVSPLFHITGLVGHVGVAVTCGAALVLCHRFDAPVVLRHIEREGTTFTIAAITALVALMNVPGSEGPLSRLRTVFSGGAPISAATAARFRDHCGRTVRSAYGLTETSGATHAVPPDAAPVVDPASQALSIGVPYWDTDAWVVDDEGVPVPPGTVGEIVVAGPQVVPGYWHRPEESARAFGGDGFRTGDIGFMDEDGWFYVVDRRKDMIVASGFKVWPREVEDVLYEHPAVREAAVVGVPDPYRGETVKAYVSLRPGHQVGEGELIAHCRERMAAYKYPRAVEVRGELPKTASGKILRRELRHG